MEEINAIVYEGVLGFKSIQYTYTDTNTSIENFIKGYFDFVKVSETNHIEQNKYVYLLDSMQPREELTFSKVGNVLFIKSERWKVNYIDWEYIHSFDRMESEYSVLKYLEQNYNRSIETNMDFNIMGKDAYEQPIIINPHYCIADGRGGGITPLAETIFSIFNDPENIIRMIDFLDGTFDSVIIEFIKITQNIVDNYPELYEELNPFVRYLFEHIRNDLYDLPYEVIKGSMIATATQKYIKKTQDK